MPLIFKRNFGFRTVYADLEKRLSGAIDEIAAYFEQECLKEINAGVWDDGHKGLVYRGQLKQNLRRTKDEALEKVVTSDTKYSAAMNFGTKPFFPPLAPLAEWFRLKIGIPEPMNWKAAKRLQFKISQEGLLEHPFFTRAAYKATDTNIVKNIMAKHGFF